MVLINFRELPYSEKKVFRSGSLSHIENDEIELLKQLNIKAVIDFRSNSEISINGNFEIYRGIRIHNIPLTHGYDYLSKLKYPTELDYGEYYKKLLNLSSKEIKKIFEILSDENNYPIVYCCSIGKDRTGVISYLLLSLVGVSFAEIVYDYKKSKEFLVPNIHYFSERWIKKNLTIDDYIKRFTPSEKSLIIVNDYINENYGGVYNFLLKQNLDEKTLHKVKFLYDKK